VSRLIKLPGGNWVDPRKVAGIIRLSPEAWAPDACRVVVQADGNFYYVIDYESDAQARETMDEIAVMVMSFD
jgi:hypothetical protein